MSTITIPERKVPTRRISFDDALADLPKHFAGHDDVIASHLIASLSSVFPDGEDFFVRSVRSYRDKIDDPELKRQVAGFIGQEAMHGREHRALNDRLDALGYPSKRVERFYEVGPRDRAGGHCRRSPTWLPCGARTLHGHLRRSAAGSDEARTGGSVTRSLTTSCCGTRWRSSTRRWPSTSPQGGRRVRAAAGVHHEPADPSGSSAAWRSRRSCRCWATATSTWGRLKQSWKRLKGSPPFLS